MLNFMESYVSELYTNCNSIICTQILLGMARSLLISGSNKYSYNINDLNCSYPLIYDILQSSSMNSLVLLLFLLIRLLSNCTFTTVMFQECLLELLKTKTVIYITHQVEFLPDADLILVSGLYISSSIHAREYKVSNSSLLIYLYVFLSYNSY
jgi:hypothetical protein